MMNDDMLLLIKIFLDLLICLVIFLFIFKFRKLYKLYASVNKFYELKQLLKESQEAAERFVFELEKAKDELKAFADDLIEKEKKLTNLISESKTLLNSASSLKCCADETRTNYSWQVKYDEVLNLSRNGLNEEQISRDYGIPKGEVDLILNLARAKGD